MVYQILVIFLFTPFVSSLFDLILTDSCSVFQHFVVVVQSLNRVQLFCNSMDCSPPGSSVCCISQSRILEWVAISFSRGSSQPRDHTQVSCTAGRSPEATRCTDLLSCVKMQRNLIPWPCCLCVWSSRSWRCSWPSRFREGYETGGLLIFSHRS